VTVTGLECMLAGFYNDLCFPTGMACLTGPAFTLLVIPFFGDGFYIASCMLSRLVTTHLDICLLTVSNSDSRVSAKVLLRVLLSIVMRCTFLFCLVSFSCSSPSCCFRAAKTCCETLGGTGRSAAASKQNSQYEEHDDVILELLP
jgi:hypothetical protein